MKNMKTMIVGGVVVMITVLLLVSNVYLSSTGDFKCTNTEDAIIKVSAKVVMPSRPTDQEKKDASLSKYCAMHTQVCATKTSEKTPQVLEICQPYR
ncbi:hypothetical protein [Magnetovibrio sp.]|uniref:hypothetical protein n=1 Tax=Magnetovibrio sp. TaxID=2024836 RepID=UPI002F9599E1